MAKSLMIHEEAGEKLVEAYHLALFLGYAQQHLLRKQVLTDWGGIFEAGVDYEVVEDEARLRRYEAAHEERGFGKIRAMKPARGRLFFTASGIQKVLLHTSKDIDLLEDELRRAGVLEQFPSRTSRHPALEGGEAELNASSEASSEASSAVGIQAPRDDPGNRSSALEQRKWEYGVLERLLEHLQVLSDPHLQKLAITSAEVALGRDLEELRAGLESARAHAGIAALVGGLRAPEVDSSDSSLPGGRLDGLFPGTPGVFYTLSEIAAKAGGYSARAAGTAANLVAARRGHGPTAIRNDNLAFNRVYERPDASGTPRVMYSFDAGFANEVLLELRSNPQFEPQPYSPPSDPSVEFGRTDRRYPILSRGPFEEDEQPASSS